MADRRRETKGQPVAPVLPVELVVTILTPPGPCPSSNMLHFWCNRHNSNIGNVLACRLFWINRVDNPCNYGRLCRSCHVVAPILPALAVNLVVTGLRHVAFLRCNDVPRCNVGTPNRALTAREDSRPLCGEPSRFPMLKTGSRFSRPIGKGSRPIGRCNVPTGQQRNRESRRFGACPADNGNGQGTGRGNRATARSAIEKGKAFALPL